MTDMTRSEMQLALSQIWETVYDHGQGKYVGHLSRDQRDTAFANITRLRNYVNECAARDDALAGLIAQAVEVDLDKVMRATTRDEKIVRPGVYEVPAQEPFGWTDCAETDEGARPLYEHPPAAQRQPLTDEQISALSKGHITRNGFARAIEAAVIDAANSKANAAWPLMCEKRVEIEREACAKACESLAADMTVPAEWSANQCAAAIRARGQASILGAELP